MHFLIGLGVVVALIWLFIVSPGFRKAVGVLLAIVVVGIFLLYLNGKKEAEERQRQQTLAEQQAATSIRISDISLTDVSLAGEVGARTLTGTITNNSKFGLGGIRFLVTIRDCTGAPPQDCRTIGQETTSTRGTPWETSWPPSTTLVPSGQVRLFNTYVMHFQNMPPASNPQWEYKITEIRAAF